jgi:hypothetical protein
MRPIEFEGYNATFTKPDSMTDDECMPIHAYLGNDQHGRPFVNTVWQPNKEDIEAINAGRPIVLSVFSEGLPPVGLFTLDEKGLPNE